MPLRPCSVCGIPNRGARCPEHQQRRPGAQAQGYTRDHQQRSAEAIEAEPWCHTPGGCPFGDAGTPANPLTGGHPHPLSAFDGDREAWMAQPRIPQCRRCNSGKRERRGAWG